MHYPYSSLNHPLSTATLASRQLELELWLHTLLSASLRCHTLTAPTLTSPTQCRAGSQLLLHPTPGTDLSSLIARLTRLPLQLPQMNDLQLSRRHQTSLVRRLSREFVQLTTWASLNCRSPHPLAPAATTLHNPSNCPQPWVRRDRVSTTQGWFPWASAKPPSSGGWCRCYDFWMVLSSLSFCP